MSWNRLATLVWVAVLVSCSSEGEQHYVPEVKPPAAKGQVQGAVEAEPAVGVEPSTPEQSLTPEQPVAPQQSGTLEATGSPPRLDVGVLVLGWYADLERKEKIYRGAVCHLGTGRRPFCVADYGALHGWGSLARPEAPTEPAIPFEETSTLSAALAKGVVPCPKCLWFATAAARTNPRWKGPDSGPRFVYAGRKGFLDRSTGLLWQRQGGEPNTAYAQAKSHAETLELEGEIGWRLPTNAELKTIADHITRDDFGYMDGEYWTSDTADKTGKRHVRAVKPMDVPAEQWHEVLHRMASYCTLGNPTSKAGPTPARGEVRELAVDLPDGVKMEFAYLASGSFRMGCDDRHWGGRTRFYRARGSNAVP